MIRHRGPFNTGPLSGDQPLGQLGGERNLMTPASKAQTDGLGERLDSPGPGRDLGTPTVSLARERL